MAPTSFQRHRDRDKCCIRHCSSARDGGWPQAVLQGGSWHWSCSNLGTVVVPVLGFPKPIKEGKEESKQSFVLAELSLDTAPSNSRSTELRMSNLKRH